MGVECLNHEDTNWGSALRRGDTNWRNTMESVKKNMGLRCRLVVQLMSIPKPLLFNNNLVQ